MRFVGKRTRSGRIVSVRQWKERDGKRRARKARTITLGASLGKKHADLSFGIFDASEPASVSASATLSRRLGKKWRKISAISSTLSFATSCRAPFIGYSSAKFNSYSWSAVPVGFSDRDISRYARIIKGVFLKKRCEIALPLSNFTRINMNLWGKIAITRHTLAWLTISRVDINKAKKKNVFAIPNSRKWPIARVPRTIQARAILLIYRGRVIISRGHNTHCYMSISFVAGRKAGRHGSVYICCLHTRANLERGAMESATKADGVIMILWAEHDRHKSACRLYTTRCTARGIH